MALDMLLLAALVATTDPVDPLQTVTPPAAERTAANVEAEAGTASDPLTFEIAYTADLLSSVSGGRRRGTRYIDNLEAIATADLGALAGIPRTTATVRAFHNNGARFSGSVVGDAQTISGIEAGARLTRLYEAWVEHRGVGDRWSVKLGLFDINSEFDALATSFLFVHSAHGMGTDIAQSGPNGPSTFPNTAAGIRGQVRLGERLTLRAAVVDGLPNDPDQPRRMLIRFGASEGALLIAEADAALGPVRLLAGAWDYTSSSPDRFDEGVGASVVRQAHSRGAYLRGEAQVAGTAERGVRAFARLGIADGRVNPFGAFASGGVTWRGPLPGRPRDEAGVAFAYARAGSASRSLSWATIGAADRGEMAYELTYRFQLTDWLSVQPDVQYIADPGLDPTLKDAVAVGMRLSASLPL